MADDVLESIHAVMHLFRSKQYRALRDSPHDITHMEGKALGFFARHDGATLSDLVAHTGRDKGQLARLVSSLRDSGLLEAQADERDRRSSRLFLTEAGRAVHQLLQQQAQCLSDQAVAGFNADERSQLMTLLAKVKANLDAAD